MLNNKELDDYRKGIEDGITKCLKAIKYLYGIEKAESITEIIYHSDYGITYDNKFQGE